MPAQSTGCAWLVQGEQGLARAPARKRTEFRIPAIVVTVAQ